MEHADNIISTKLASDQAIPLEWVVGVSVTAGIVLVLTVIGLVLLIRWIRTPKTATLDNDPTDFRTLRYVTRYSSSDTGESQLDAGFLEDTAKPNVSISHVQPKNFSYYHRNLLCANHEDTSGTSDEEESAIQRFANSNGRIWFTIKYDPRTTQLNVTIVKARYLKARGMCHELRDPFVRVYILPDELNFQQTKPRRRTLSPHFNETFTFQISPEEVNSRIVKLSVYDIDKKNVRHSLGHAIIALEKVDLTNECIQWKNLDTISQKTNQVGELYFSLCCNPYTDRIKVSILRGRDFRFKRIPKTEQTELFIRVEFYYGSKLIKFKDTTKVKYCENPNIFQNFSFSVIGRHFDSCSICLIAMATKDNNVIKCARVSVGSFLYARGDELQHWQDMMSNPRSSIERWHFLTEVT